MVCDASVVLKLLVDEENTEHAISLAASNELTAPELVVAEIGNALWAHVHNGSFGFDIAEELVHEFFSLSLALQPLNPLVGRALQIANALNHPIYDCFYLALAESLSVPMVTADRRFISAVRRGHLETVEVIQLGEFA